MKKGCILLCLAFTLFGCNSPRVTIAPATVSTVEVRYAKGGTVVKDRAVIVALVQAMRIARPDNGLYDTAKTTQVVLYAGDAILCKVRTGSSLFDYDGQQYRSEEFERIVLTITTREKKGTQPPAQGDGARRAAS